MVQVREQDVMPQYRCIRRSSCLPPTYTRMSVFSRGSG